MRATVFTVARIMSCMFIKIRITNENENFCTRLNQSMDPFSFNLFKNKVFVVELRGFHKFGFGA